MVSDPQTFYMGPKSYRCISVTKSTVALCSALCTIDIIHLMYVDIPYHLRLLALQTTSREYSKRCCCVHRTICSATNVPDSNSSRDYDIGGYEVSLWWSSLKPHNLIPRTRCLHVRQNSSLVNNLGTYIH